MNHPPITIDLPQEEILRQASTIALCRELATRVDYDLSTRLRAIADQCESLINAVSKEP